MSTDHTQNSTHSSYHPNTDETFSISVFPNNGTSIISTLESLDEEDLDTLKKHAMRYYLRDKPKQTDYSLFRD
jgi:hypothetical protein